MGDQRGDENDDAEHVEDPDDAEEANNDLAPVVVPDQTFQAKQQCRRQHQVRSGYYEPHPPERPSDRFPARMLRYQRERDQDRCCDKREGRGIVPGLARCGVQTSRVERRSTCGRCGCTHCRIRMRASSDGVAAGRVGGVSLSLRDSVTRHRAESLAHSARERDNAFALVAVERLVPGGGGLFAAAGGLENLGQVDVGVALELG